MADSSTRATASAVRPRRGLFTRALIRCPLQLGFFADRRDVDAPVLAVVVKGTYSFAPGDTAKQVDSAEILSLAGDLHFGDDSNASLRFPSDFAPWKPRADVILVGTYHAKGPPKKAARVEFGLDAQSPRSDRKTKLIRKALALIGDREWVGGLAGETQSEPAPLQPMALRYELAFGGDGSASNPVGKGFWPRGGKRPQGLPLPNIEAPDAMIKSPEDVPPPAGFGPLEVRWASRLSRAGTFDDRWLKERWPWYPKDFDFGYFNAAPPDQQVAGYLTGDERFFFEGLHPTLERVDARLPGVRPRCFVKRRSGSAGVPFEEVTFALDTLWIDADSLVLTLTWRGSVVLSSLKSQEIETMLVVQESLAEPILPAEHYLEPSLWTVEKRSEEELAVEEEAIAYDEPIEEKEEQQDDDSKFVADARKMLADVGAPPELMARLAKVDKKDDFASILKEHLGDPDDKMLEEHLQKGLKDAEDSLRAAGHDPAKIAPEKPVSPAEPPREPRLTREDVETRAAKGESFKDKDLSDLDLSRLDLRGLVFDGAVMIRVNLSESKLDGSHFAKSAMTGVTAINATFSGAFMEDADLGKSDLSGADFGGANAARTRFVEAKLNQASFEAADLTGADLSRAEMPYVKLIDTDLEGAILAEAKLGGATASRARCRAANFTGADLSSAVLDRADLGHAVLDQVKLDRASLRDTFLEFAAGKDASVVDADLRGARFADSKFAGSRFDRARGDKSFWSHAVPAPVG